MKILMQWYEENNIKDIGYEDINKIYDEGYHYIGKGPNGYYELLQIIENIAKKLR